MMTDPRHRLLQTFGCLLAGADTYPAAIIDAAVKLAAWATHSAKRYRQCRRREPDLGYGLEAERYEHLGESDRIDLHGRLYLDLALQFRLGECHGRSFAEFVAMAPQGRCNDQPLPPPEVLHAMRAELWRVHEALVELGSVSPRGGGGRIEPAPQALLTAMAAFTPDRTRPKAGWSPSRAAALRCLSTSDSWVALVDDETAPDGERSAALVIPLHVALGRSAGGQAQGNDDAEPFGVRWYPSLLTSLDYFSSPHVDAEGSLGWWATLDAAEAWACSHYAELLSQRRDARQPLQGRHVARWDLAQAVPVLDRDGRARVVGGSSHGAAFALCLMQAIARAHTSHGG